MSNFVEMGFGEPMHEKYEKGITSAEKAIASAGVQAGAAAKSATASSSKKNRHPSEEEAATLKGIAGVTWQEAVACQVAVTVGIVPDIHEIETMGYGSNPLNCDAAKACRKASIQTVQEYVKAGDATGLHDKHLVLADELIESGYPTMGARLMHLSTQLHRVTIAVGFNSGYIKYWDAWNAAHKLKPLPRPWTRASSSSRCWALRRQAATTRRRPRKKSGPWTARFRIFTRRLRT